jgi:hypothetical protein
VGVIPGSESGFIDGIRLQVRKSYGPTAQSRRINIC